MLPVYGRSFCKEDLEQRELPCELRLFLEELVTLTHHCEFPAPYPQALCRSAGFIPLLCKLLVLSLVEALQIW